MRHVFILNPAAGKHQSALTIVPEIEAFFKRYPMQYAIHTTTAPGEATEMARTEAAKGDAVRVYACGGDGTLLEVASGVVGLDNAELACIPCGSGNDFVRLWPEETRFRDIALQVMGTAQKLDAIRCNGKLSLNLCSMGLDANIADRMAQYKHLPLVSGSMAYNLALVKEFCRPIGQKMKIVMDTVGGKVEREGEYLFALAANGQYYGGGYHGAPLSQPDDGVLDFILIKKISHLRVLTILGKYKRGEHMDLDCCESFRGTSMTVSAEKPLVYNTDGECDHATQVEFSVLPSAISFVVPAASPDELLKNYEISENCQFAT